MINYICFQTDFNGIEFWKIYFINCLSFWKFELFDLYNVALNENNCCKISVSQIKSMILYLYKCLSSSKRNNILFKQESFNVYIATKWLMQERPIASKVKRQNGDYSSQWVSPFRCTKTRVTHRLIHSEFVNVFHELRGWIYNRSCQKTVQMMSIIEGQQTWRWEYSYHRKHPWTSPSKHIISSSANLRIWLLNSGIKLNIE